LQDRSNRGSAEAVEDAETDLEGGEEEAHIVEIGNEILTLLRDAAPDAGP